MGSRGAQDGPHAWPFAVQARSRLWQAVWLSLGIFVAVSFAAVLRVTGNGPRWGVDHSDPSAVDFCVAYVAVGGLSPRVEDVIPQDGVGSGGLTRLWPSQDQQSALRGVSAPDIACGKTGRLN